MSEAHVLSYFNLQLLPEYNGSDNQSMVEWLEKPELICIISGADDVAGVIPLCLNESALAVYLQLPGADKKIAKVKEVFVAEFTVDPFMP